MKPVNINAFDILGGMAAASQIAFGAAVAYQAAGKVQATQRIGTAHNLLGIADMDIVEKDVDGFYSEYDIVPIITAGRCRVWVTSNNTSGEDLLAGDYLEIADVGASGTLPVGAFQQMTAEGTESGADREATSVARALEDVVDMEDVVTATLSGKTITVDDSSIVAVGDYCIIEDDNAQAEINRVAALPSDATITLQFTPSTITLVDAFHKLHQVEAMLI